MAFCGECGHQLRPGVHFCQECGTAVPAGDAGAEQAPAGEAGETSGTPAEATAPEPEAPSPVEPAEVPAPTEPPTAATAPVEAPTVATPAVAPSGPPAGPPAMGPPPSAASPDRRKRLLAAAVIFLVIAGIVFSVFAFRGNDDDGDRATGGDSSSGGEIFLEPINATVPDPFTDSAVDGEEEPVEVDLPVITRRSTTTTAAGVQAVATVSGAQVGLYGGTLDTQRCDPEQMIEFLTDDEVKAKAWADVQGITPAEIPSYIRSLTPVILTRDTRVTNHGYANGRATPRQSVLQAGTAVLVDRYGVPRVKCGCGNPLVPPVAVAGTPVYTGPRWEGFDPAVVVVVVIDRPVDRFILVDLDGGAPFSRTIGVNGRDAELPPAQRCKVFPDDPDCDDTTTSTTKPPKVTPPDTPPEKLAEIGNIGGVQNGPTQPSILSFDRAVFIQWVVDYHWNNATGATPGTISLRSLRDGAVYGPWRTKGLPGQGGVPNAYWRATVNEVFPAGEYEVIDSDPSTWATNAEAGNRGMVTVYGWSVGQPVEPPTTTTTVPPPTTTTMATGIGDTEAAAVGLLGELLSSCSTVDLLETGSLGAGPTGMWLVAGYLNEGEVRYLVNPSTVDVVPQDQFSAEIAVECGFYQP